MQAERGGIFVFVPGSDDAIRFVLVASLEGCLFLGNEVFAVVNAPRAKEDAVALFHVLFHVVNMNQLDPVRQRAVAEVVSDCSRLVRLLKIPLKLDSISSKNPNKRAGGEGRNRTGE